ncbi:Leucine carboxyl methyltransferase superfamily [Talaromyces stipitatus ATCC 10500]|uniref:Leucine carboxyl methyltransferase 1 n=1 Tax=Talaromyces stipitatus (strain ATCC 10500 / CBS 375.48 / QM 6759 / NRRL 1006) TaxID=441959 RepID=B8M0T0_TALSN|nr:Leucine carboxyl methyltransferase superfamily [Talaromyces stipitatus ATCC 10500]EED21463.1 Leucine carboxyl methyltransferase superfamily [Talaromyces stipitatus ATCC 10500]
MSVNQIPNLNTLRRGGGGLRARLRGRGRGSGGSTSDDTQSQAANNTAAAKDKIIQGTDNDASVSRLSAVELGYLDDVFARALTPSGGGPGSRRFPIINRGTYVRTTAIDQLVNCFLDEDGKSQHATKKQIISLGAGSDTRPFRIFSKKQRSQLVYHELDFSVNTSAKIKAIRSSPLLQRAIQADTEALSTAGNEQYIADDSLHLPNYHIHPIDLRALAAKSSASTAKSAMNDSQQPTEDHNTSTAETKELLPGIDPTLPTLLISECCLIYLSPDDADAVIDYFSQTIFPPTTPLGLIIYEPIRPDDPFGKTMVSNLAARGIQLQTLHKYASLPAQRQRFAHHRLGSGQGAVDIDFIWNYWISNAEKERVAALEMLDEIEEWILLAQHYCVAWGWRGDIGKGDFALWKGIRSE